MSEMIDRVARAIASKPYLQSGKAQDWDNLTERHRSWCREQAVAAVTAMREPTEMMIRAAQPELWATDEYLGTGYRDMIDAALSGAEFTNPYATEERA